MPVIASRQSKIVYQPPDGKIPQNISDVRYVGLIPTSQNPIPIQPPAEKPKDVADVEIAKAITDAYKNILSKSQAKPSYLEQAIESYLKSTLTPQPLTSPSELALKQIEQQIRRQFAERGLFSSTASAQSELAAQSQYLADIRKQRMQEQQLKLEAALGALAQAQALQQAYREQLIKNLQTMLAGNEQFLKAKERLARSLMQIYNIDMQSALKEAERRMLSKMAEKGFWEDIGAIFGGGAGAIGGFLIGGPIGAIAGYGLGSATGEFLGGELYGDVSVPMPTISTESPSLEDIYG